MFHLKSLKHRAWYRILTVFSKRVNFQKAQVFLLRKREPGELHYRSREFAESLLRETNVFEEPANFEAAILVGPNDLEVIKLSCTALLENAEFTGRPFLIAPGSIHNNLRNMVGADFEIVSDDELLSSNLQDLCTRYVPPKKQGWIKQQVLKFVSTQVLARENLLLLDADTVLLEKQDWIDVHGVQNLNVSVECHKPYIEHFERFMRATGQDDIARRKIGVSFVTHHQLMQRHIVKDIFQNQNISFEEGMKIWLETLEFTHSDSAGSEWHTYGCYLALKFPERVRLSQWRNTSIGRSRLESVESFQELPQFVRGYNSVSLHHYL
jgi:hypothetical protein